MPNGNGFNTDIRRVATALLLAAILGAWGFAATRASSDELARVESESKERDRPRIEGRMVPPEDP